MFWAIIFTIGAFLLSFLIGGGISIEFVKIIAIFVVGMTVVTAFKKMWDIFGE